MLYRFSSSQICTLSVTTKISIIIHLLNQQREEDIKIYQEERKEIESKVKEWYTKNSISCQK